MIKKQSDSVSGMPEQEAFQPFVEAYTGYTNSVAEVWEPTEIEQRGAEAYQRYMQAIEEVWPPEVQARVSDAWNVYVRILEEASQTPQLRRIVSQAFRMYLQAVQQAWQELDLEAVDPPTLAVIGQGISAVAWLAAVAQGQADMLAGSDSNSSI